jgi:hypothetical protein
MMRLRVAVGIVAATVAVAGSATVAVAQSPGPIRVLNTSHEIDFPRAVVLRLDAESDSAITQITLHYNLGSREIQVYGYPAFTPARRVSAEFTIKTDGASYLPSGVDIKYFYTVTDAAGNELESDRTLLEYKDPSFEWKRLQQNDITFLWHDRPAEGVARVAREVDSRLEPVRRLFGAHLESPKKAIIVNGSAEATRSFPTLSNAATETHLYGGFAFGDLDLFVIVGLNTDGIIHEMTHLLLAEMVDSPFARVPSWLNEGLAMYFESSVRGRDVTVSRAADRGGLFPLRSMGSVPGRPEDVRLFYAQSWSVVTHMMSVHGEARMSALLEAIDDGEPVADAVQTAYGLTLDELQRQWQDGLRGESLGVSAVDPGTFGTSLIIASAVAVTTMVILWRWLRRIGSPVDTREADR